MIYLRHATAADEAFILSVRNDPDAIAASLTKTEKDSFWFNARMNDPGHRLFVVKNDGAQVGIASYQMISPITAELSLALAPEYRGKGWASEIIEALVDEGRKAGVDRFHATVQGTNVKSLRAFLREGFTPTRWVYLEKTK